MTHKVKALFGRVFGIALLFSGLAFALAGCSPTASSPSIYGEWVSSFGDGYEILESTMSYDDNYGGSYNWAGDVVAINSFSDEAGCIIIKMTSNGGGGGYTNGKYYGNYYSKLTLSSVFLGMAASGYTPVVYNTVEEAKAAFTATSVSTWYSTGGGEYAKQ
jgi:hypothetical protein